MEQIPRPPRRPEPSIPWRDRAWIAGFWTGSLVVAVFGEPRPLALFVAGAGILTGTAIAWKR